GRQVTDCQPTGQRRLRDRNGRPQGRYQPPDPGTARSRGDRHARDPDRQDRPVNSAAPYMGIGQPMWAGVVTVFDRASGTGTVLAEDGTEYPFHCIEVADGTRTIEEGTRVTFE